MGGCLIHTWDLLWVDVLSILGTYGWMFDPYLGLVMGGCLIHTWDLLWVDVLSILGTYGWMFDPYSGLVMDGCLIHTSGIFFHFFSSLSPQKALMNFLLPFRS